MVYLKANNKKLFTSTGNNKIDRTTTHYKLKSFEKFLFVFTSLCLKRKSSNFQWYLKELIQQLKKTEISSVEDILHNVKYLDDNDNNNFKFSKLQLQVIVQKGK